MADEIYEYAAKLISDGISIIPINGSTKKPTLTSWKEYQTRPPTLEELERWYKGGLLKGIAKLTGKINNCVVVDCDTQDAHDKMRQFCPDIMETPVVRTPRPGTQYYFEYTDGLRNKAAYYPGLDVRTDGGYANIPPTCNGNGRRYSFVEGYSFYDVKPIPMPIELKRFLIDSLNGNMRQYRPSNGARDGERHDALIRYLGGILGRNPSIGLEELTDLAYGWNRKNHPPVTDPADLRKMESSIRTLYDSDKRNHPERRALIERPEWNTLLDSYIEETSGIFKISSVFNDLGVKTPEEKSQIKMLLKRRVEKGTIEKIGNYDGGYRLIDKALTENNWLDAGDLAPSALVLPLGLTDMFNIYDGDVIIVAGNPNAGKTALTINTASLNLDSFQVHYFNSSETGTELFKRKVGWLDAFKDDRQHGKLSRWKSLHHYDRASEFHDVIRPGIGNLNIIDYLEIYDSFYLIGEKVAKIHQALNGAIAIIAVQKNPNSPDPLGGFHSLQKPTLALGVSSGPEGYTCKILKGKAWKGSPLGQTPSVDYQLISKINIFQSGEWK